MKRISVAMIVAAILFVAAAFVPNNAPHIKAAATVRADDGAGCSLASVAGKWGYTYTGTLVLPTGGAPVAAVGRFTLDRDGDLSGTQTRSNGGVSAEETITATVTVNADCSGTGNFNVYQSQNGQPVLLRTGVLALLFDNDSRELRAIFESLTLVNGTNLQSLPVVITVNAKKIVSPS